MVLSSGMSQVGMASETVAVASEAVPAWGCLCAVQAPSVAAMANVTAVMVFILSVLSLFEVCVFGIDVPHVSFCADALYGIDGGYGGKH